MSSEHAWLTGAALMAALSAAPATGAPPPSAGTLRLDPQRTTIAFHLGGALHDTDGAFRLADGWLAADAASGAARGRIVVDAASADTQDGARDRRLRNAILDVAHYPEITFVPTHVAAQVAPDGAFHAVLHGVFALHGGTHESDVAVDGRVDGDELTATARFAVPYVAWGVPDPSLLLLTCAKSVDVEVHAAGRVTRDGGTPAAEPRG